MPTLQILDEPFDAAACLSFQPISFLFRFRGKRKARAVCLRLREEGAVFEAKPMALEHSAHVWMVTLPPPFATQAELIAEEHRVPIEFGFRAQTASDFEVPALDSVRSFGRELFCDPLIHGYDVYVI
ncbi:MAG: hypothetical protein ACOYXA_02995 [Bacteroidota bacterium]